MNFVDSYGTLWKMMELCGFLWNLMEDDGSLWILMEPHGSCWNLARAHKTFYNPLEHLGPFKNFHDLPEHFLVFEKKGNPRTSV